MLDVHNDSAFSNIIELFYENFKYPYIYYSLINVKTL